VGERFSDGVVVEKEGLWQGTTSRPKEKKERKKHSITKGADRKKEKKRPISWEGGRAKERRLKRKRAPSLIEIKEGGGDCPITRVGKEERRLLGLLKKRPSAS